MDKQDNSSIETKWLADTIEDMRMCEPVKEFSCPHCGIPIRYPLVARSSDIKLFEEYFASMQRVANKYGITANLLAEIKTECMIAMAKKKHD